MSDNPFESPKAPLESAATIKARQLGIAKKYLAGAVIVGATELVDASMLIANQGEFSGFSFVVSLLELFWVVVTLVVVFRTRHRPTRILAVAFIAYFVFGIALSMSVDDAKVVPMWAVLVGGLFAAAYGGGSTYAFTSVRRATAAS
jgi:hypothetical protein